uniref:Uncharacterized protein LOC101502800 isoform X2 n=2 Tax=Cicer arietinum TaxID=3827 RepID=A0A3Q7XZY4_CICAR|nr:uncharacterized protein LOC101502800 isoform X2 [Cicer arietinum]
MAIIYLLLSDNFLFEIAKSPDLYCAILKFHFILLIGEVSCVQARRKPGGGCEKRNIGGDWYSSWRSCISQFSAMACLCGGIHVKLHSSTKINLPSLKILQLDIDSVDCIDTLLSGCSTLESLDICFAPKCLSTIRMPHSLKSLKIGVENNDIGTHFEIVSPGLEYLSINQITAFGPITVCNFPEVTQVFLDVFSLEESVNALLNLLLAISATNTLELRRSTTKIIM